MHLVGDLLGDIELRPVFVLRRHNVVFARVLVQVWVGIELEEEISGVDKEKDNCNLNEMVSCRILYREEY